MIEITVKTLDSFNHSFSVEEESTVEQLKEKIRATLGLEIDRQRLIFCGRVLQDDQKLKDCGVDNGKCLHLVQRPPPSPPSRRLARDNREPGRDLAGRSAASPLRQQIRHLLSAPTDLVVEQQQAISMSPTAGRMEFIRRMNAEIRETLTLLRRHAPDLVGDSGERAEPAAEPMDTDTFDEPNETETLEDHNDDSDEARDRRNIRIHRNARAMRSTGWRPRDLGHLMEELDLMQEDFAPFRNHYIHLLRNGADAPSEAREHNQRLSELVCDAIHSFAHCNHAISDINYNVETRQLTSEPASVRHPLPMQAHINVVTTTGGRRTVTSDSGRNGAAPTAAEGAERAAPRTQAATPATLGVGVTMTSRLSRPAAPDRRPVAPHTHHSRNATSHTTTTTRPVPGSDAYQVEIETRGHIAIPLALGNTLLDGLASVASNLHQAQQVMQRAQVANGNPPPPPPRDETASIDSATPTTAVDTNTKPDTSEPNVPTVPLPSSEPPPSLGQTAVTTEASAPSEDSDEYWETVEETTPVDTPPRREEHSRRCKHSRTGRSTSQGRGRGSREEEAQRAAPGRATAQLMHTHVLVGAGGAPGTATAAAQPAGNATPPASDDQRPRVLMDLENLLHGLTHGGGVEVVMSVEEIPAFVTGAVEELNQNDRMYVTPFVANVAPPTELLQNVIANVLRQNIGDAILLQGQNRAAAQSQNQGQAQNQVQTQNQGQPQSQGQNQNQGQPQNQGQTQNQGQNQNQAHTQRQGQAQNQGSGQNQDTNADRRQHWQAPIHNPGRQATERAHSFAMACMVYDRYMHCDSPHARTHLQQRRAHYQEQADAQERARAARPPASEIDLLMNRNPRFTARHMAVMIRLFSGPVSPEGHLNAFMVTIARHLFLDQLIEIPNDPPPMPTEFSFIRIHLRDFVQGLLERAIERSGRTNTFEAVTERIIQQNLSFIQNMGNITRINGNADPLASVRAITRSRLPAIIACVMSEAFTDMFAARFYSVISRFFTDLCTLFLCFCEDGFDGLARLYDNYFTQLTSNFEASARDWLRVVSYENLLAIRNTMEVNTRSITRMYFRCTDGSVPPAVELLPAPPPPEETPNCFLPNEESDDAEDTPASDDSQSTQSVRRKLREFAERDKTSFSTTPSSDDSDPSTASDVRRDLLALGTGSLGSTPTDDNRSPSESAAPPLEDTSTGSQKTKDLVEEPTRRVRRREETFTSPTTSPGVSPPNAQGVQDSSMKTGTPMETVLEHFGERWAPVLQSDAELLEARSAQGQPPFSDAYLSGMPSRKRRCLRDSRPETTLDGLMNEGIREVAEVATANGVDASDLHQLLRESVRSLVRQRVSQEPDDYNPTQFQDTASFLDDAKPKNEKQKEKNPDPRQDTPDSVE